MNPTFRYYAQSNYGIPVDLDKVLDQPSRYPKQKALIVVRNQEEYDYMSALALVSGKPVEIHIDSRTDVTDLQMYMRYRPPFTWVFISEKQP